MGPERQYTATGGEAAPPAAPGSMMQAIVQDGYGSVGALRLARIATPEIGGSEVLNPGPATLRHHDATLAALRGAGFSVAMTAHAYALLDSYVYGFALQEASLPFNPQTVAGATEAIMQHHASEYPHLAEMATEHILRPGYDFGSEFEIGLSVILDALTGSIPGKGGHPPP